MPSRDTYCLGGMYPGQTGWRLQGAGQGGLKIDTLTGSIDQDQISGLADSNTFVFDGGDVSSKTARELCYDVLGENTYVNGDGTVDFCIKIAGIHTLPSSDFVL